MAGRARTRLHRQTVDTEGNAPTGYDDTVTTPWLAASYEWRPAQHVYASWGEGAESYVVPEARGRRGGYTNAGQALQAKSRQWKWAPACAGNTTHWGVAWFDIDRPAITDTGTDYVLDGSAHHRGIDGNVTQTLGVAAACRRCGCKARREGAADPTLNGRTPVNVPEQTLKAQARYRVSYVPGLDLQANVTYEGRRNVLDDGSIELPSWTRTDLAARYTHKLDGTSLTWTLGLVQRVRQARVEGIALAVWARLPVPARGPHGRASRSLQNFEEIACHADRIQAKLRGSIPQ